MVEFIIGASGTGKTTEMFSRIRAFADSGAEQCILVPEQYSNDFDKKLYHYLGAKDFNELFSLSFSSLARQLFQLYGEPERRGEYADDMARMIIVYQAIASAEKRPEMLRYFRRGSSHNGFAEEVMKLIGDMKRSGITPQQLYDKAELLETHLRDKTSDIAAVYSEYERLMLEYGFKDNYENIRFAAEIANKQRYFAGKCVCLDEFESFTGDQLEMLRVILASAKDVVITLRTDDVSAGEFTLFETVNSTYRRLASVCRELHLDMKVTKRENSYRFKYPDLKYLSENIMRNKPVQPEKAPCAENICIFEARDMYSEAEYVCAEIKHIIAADRSVRYRDIAIVSNNIAGYADVLKAAFRRYDIPYFLSIERTVSHTAIMSFFLSLLDLLTARRFRSEQIFRLLKCGILSYELTDVSLLENYCYKWGIDGDVWLEPFTAEDTELKKLEGIRSAVIEPLKKVRGQLRKKLSAEKMCQILYDHLCECEAERNLGILMSRLIREDRDNDAAELKRLWSCLMDILDSLAFTLGDKELSFPELARMIRSMVGRLTYSVPPQTLDAVTAASSRTARLDSPKVIFAVGSTEGDFPNQVSLHGLFSENDKQKLSDMGIEIARPLTDLIASERLIVYKTLSAASERLYLTYPRSDLGGQVKYPAQITDVIMKMFSEDILLTDGDMTPDHYAVTYHAAYYHYMQERAKNNRYTASIEKALLSDPVYRSRVISALSRSGKRNDDRISPEIMEKLKSFDPLRLSPTGVENYNNCHFMYFCSDLLRLQVPERLELDVRITGDITHNCFRSILASRSKASFISMSYEELGSEIKAEADKYKLERLAGDFAKTPQFGLFFNKLTERLTDVFVHTQQALMASDFVPARFEFELRGENALMLPFGDGKTLSFGGIADRMDTCEINGKKYLRVVDYKSSGKNIDENTLAAGHNLQMLLYLFAATEKNAAFGGYYPAGALYTPVQISDIKTEEAKNNTYNQAQADSALKTTGLLLDDKNVVEAMEHEAAGRFIPARLTQKGVFDSRSSVMPSENMGRLRDFVYGSLIETAESLLSGNTEALPLVMGTRKPCTYCAYGNICGNPDGKQFRVPESEKAEAAADILGRKKEGGAE